LPSSPRRSTARPSTSSTFGRESPAVRFHQNGTVFFTRVAAGFFT
jgi:hypothetical protein